MADIAHRWRIIHHVYRDIYRGAGRSVGRSIAGVVGETGVAVPIGVRGKSQVPQIGRCDLIVNRDSHTTEFQSSIGWKGGNLDLAQAVAIGI